MKEEEEEEKRKARKEEKELEREGEDVIDEDDSDLPQKPICALMLIRIRDWGRRR